MLNRFWLETTLSVVCFAVCFYALDALDFERFLKKGHSAQAQFLYWILAISLAWMVKSFMISLLYRG